MAKVTLEFDMFEEANELKAAMNGSKVQCAISDFYEFSIRKRLKYESDSYTKKELELIEQIKKEFFEALDGHDVKLD